MLDFMTAQSAGLTQTEIAKVLGVSRVTINLWVNGKMKPHRYHRDSVVEKMALLNAAIEQNLLPKTTSSRKPRHAEIAAALAQVVA
jgi:transcriptional regulator with XRE-family HTH domain